MINMVVRPPAAPPKATTISFKEALDSRLIFLSRPATTATYRQNMAERISPGISVAINREPKDSPVIDAYNINGKLGGNSMPRVPPAAKSPMQNVRLYRLDSISGMAVMLTGAAAASL